MKIFPTITCLILLISLSTNKECIASELAYGPYSVGFKSYKTYDDSRPYLLGEDTISRPLLIHFWYPSEEKDGANPLSFKHYIDLIAQKENFKNLSSVIDENTFNYVHAYSQFAKNNLGLDTSIQVSDILNAPVYAKGGIPIHQISPGPPLLIYAPSNSKSSVQNHMICEYLASHGFMILSVASAGPNSVQRNNLRESIMAQVMDMEYLLKYADDSLRIKYTSLGLFGFSSGGNANTLFQMRNENVDAVLSLDGGQEYGAFFALRTMADFNLEKASVPYCSIVNNYENFSIYPLYSSVLTEDKFLVRMPFLDHNGFISHWSFFESLSGSSVKNHLLLSYEYMSKCALGFFSKYLKHSPDLFDSTFTDGLDGEYMQLDRSDYSSINALCLALLDNNFDAATGIMNDPQTNLFKEVTRIGILARMISDTNLDLSIWLCQKNAENFPDSWQVQYDLGFFYKKKGEFHLSKNALLKAKALNPEDSDIANLLDEINSHN